MNKTKANRVLAAPTPSISPTNASLKNKGRITFGNEAIDTDALIDFRNFDFKPLDFMKNITFDEYCGPTPESNWVIPNSLLVGAYPANVEDSETFDLLTSILKEGVSTFICLQEEYPDDDIKEEDWRNGKFIRPYYEDLKLIVKNKIMFSALSGYQIVDEKDLKFVHFPIKDCDITDDDRVMNLAINLVKYLCKGSILYLHCWGGHGRTGTLVSIMLHLMYGLEPEMAMKRCQFVHDIRKCPVVVGSPQTQTQRDQVVRVINKFKDIMREIYPSPSASPLSSPLSSPLTSPLPSPSTYLSYTPHFETIQTDFQPVKLYSNELPYPSNSPTPLKISTTVNPETYHSSSKDYAKNYEVKMSEMSVPIDPVPTLLDAYNSYQNNQQASSPSIHKAPTNVVQYDMVSNNNSYQNQAASTNLLLNQKKQQNQNFSSSGFQQHYNQLHHQQQQSQSQPQPQQLHKQQQQQHHQNNKQQQNHQNQPVFHDNSKQLAHIQSSQLPYIPQVPYAILTQSNNTTPISKYSSAEKQFLYANSNVQNENLTPENFNLIAKPPSNVANSQISGGVKGHRSIVTNNFNMPNPSYQSSSPTIRVNVSRSLNIKPKSFVGKYFPLSASFSGVKNKEESFSRILPYSGLN